MSGLLSGFEARLHNTVRSAILGAAAVVFGLVGLGCLSAALWLLVSAWHGALAAFLTLGGMYMLLALILFALATTGGSKARHRARHHAHAEGEPFIRMAEGFATGMQAGRAARSR